MSAHILSKSTFIKGLQCLKSLYLYKNRYYLRDPLSREQQAVFTRGWDVGKLAQQLFPDGIELPRPGAAAAKKTGELIASGQQVIYEACFIYDDVIVAIDILEKTKTGWVAVEVKSSRAISRTYLNDACLQYYVISGAGVKLEDFRLMHINPEYEFRESLQLDELFMSESVIDLAKEKENWVRDQLLVMKAAISAGKSPETGIGPHCDYPYTCEFHGHCWKAVPSPSVFELDSFTREEQFNLYAEGHIRPGLDFPPDLVLSGSQRIQLNSHMENRPFTDRPAVREHLSAVHKPNGFLKILSYSPAIPLFNGTRPYQPLPFAFFLEKPGMTDTETGNTSFIALPGADPGAEFHKELLKAVSGLESIVLFDPSGRQRELAQELSMPCDFTDISEVFSRYWYYQPSIAGKRDVFSLASALTGESSPEKEKFDSDILAGVAYAGLPFSDPAEKGQFFRNLEQFGSANLSACRMIFGFLERLTD